MAYDISDKAAAVRQVQDYLREISRADPEMTKVYTDGIYDENTASAVSGFQKKHGIEVTGAVDRETFEALRLAAEGSADRRSSPVKLDVFGCPLAGGAVSYGDEFDTVYIIQAALALLADFYGFEKAEINGCYDDMTENAVLCFQKIHGLDPTGCVDRKTWDEIASAYNKYIRQTM